MSAPVRPAAPTPAVRTVTVAAVLLVAAVAAVVSYAHMQHVAERAGEAWRSWLIPLSIDGLVVAASMVLLTRRRAGLPGGWLAWWALLGGVGASLAANVAAAEPDVTARVVAAWPALAFAVGIELLLSQRRVPVVDPVTAPVGEDPPAERPGGRRDRDGRRAGRPERVDSAGGDSAGGAVGCPDRGRPSRRTGAGS
ncbi:MAG: DUF2637 domain-containing protein [Pseudonocardiaceae bacterium]|nr:DUF2637 domain-containing protein [Pseudonocardiaceae bacterium]